jgi:hypothetical protein
MLLIQWGLRNAVGDRRVAAIQLSETRSSPVVFSEDWTLVRAVKAKGAALKATEQPIDTGTAAGKVLPQHARRVRGVRNQFAQGTAVGGYRKGQGCCRAALQAAEKQPLGSMARDLLLRRARQAETASHINNWLRSPGLQPKA